jgi:hypothetical protein
MLAKSQEIYRHPSSVSIKKGAFNLLKPYVKHFDTLPIINTYKGEIKFLPIVIKNRKAFSFKCRKVLVVNYDETVKEAQLTEIPKSEGLEILIAESWLSNLPDNALQFLKWIQQITFFKLTYSKTEDALESFKILEAY